MAELDAGDGSGEVSAIADELGGMQKRVVPVPGTSLPHAVGL
jgi:hypothetical protein